MGAHGGTVGFQGVDGTTVLAMRSGSGAGRVDQILRHQGLMSRSSAMTCRALYAGPKVM